MIRFARGAWCGVLGGALLVSASMHAWAQAPRALDLRAGVTGGARSGALPRGASMFVTNGAGAPVFQTSPAPTSRPALEPARVAGEMLAGAYAGIGGYFLGSWVGGFVGDALPTTSQSTLDQLDFTFGVAGAMLATAGAVTAVGNIGGQTGSYGATLGGAAGGVVVGVLLNQLIYGHARLPSDPESSRLRWVEASLEALLPSLGATIAFNSTRKSQ